MDQDIQDIKNQLKAQDKNLLLENAKYFRLEEKILELGKLLEEERKKNSANGMAKIKYNSIKNPTIKKLTTEIYDTLFSNTLFGNELLTDFNASLKEFKEYIELCNSEVELETTEEDFKLGLKKKQELENYFLNQIANDSLFEYKKSFKAEKLRKHLLQEMIYKNWNETKIKDKKHILINYVQRKNMYFNSHQTYDGFSPISSSCMPNLYSVLSYFDKTIKKQEDEVRMIKYKQQRNIYEKR